MPDDHQDGAGDRDQGFELAAAFDDPPVALAEEGVGLGRGGGGLAEDAFEVGIALPGLAGAAALPRTGWCAGDSFAHDARWAAVGNLAMSRPISARITCAPCAARCRGSHRGGRSPTGPAASGPLPAPGPVAPPASTPRAAGMARDQLLDPAGEGPIWAVSASILVQQHPGQLAVVIVEPAGQGLHQRGVLGLHPAAGQPGQRLRVALPGDQRLDHRPARQRP